MPGRQTWCLQELRGSPGSLPGHNLSPSQALPAIFCQVNSGKRKLWMSLTDSLTVLTGSPWWLRSPAMCRLGSPRGPRFTYMILAMGRYDGVHSSLTVSSVYYIIGHFFFPRNPSLILLLPPKILLTKGLSFFKVSILTLLPWFLRHAPLYREHHSFSFFFSET